MLSEESEAPLAEGAALSVGQVARRSGVAVSALHFYERQGLISSIRTGGNQRRFDRSVLRRVAVIRAAQRAGIPLSTIARALAELPDGRIPSRSDWQQMSRAWHAELDDRIRRLEQLRDSLGGCIGCGCLSLGECGFVNPGDEAGGSGAGAPVLDGVTVLDGNGPGLDGDGTGFDGRGAAVSDGQRRASGT
jgi:MerR family redox-sensitive transcriptional activator SoxR